MEEILVQARLVWRLFWDGRVPFYLKLIPLATLGYILFPIDLIPDIPLIGLGQLDDLTALLSGWKLFVNLSPREVVAEHLATLGRGRSAGASLLEEGRKGSGPGSPER